LAYATIDELAAALRIGVTAANTPTLQACVDAAAAEIDHTVDRRPEQLLPSAVYAYADVQAAADPGPGNLRLDGNSTNSTTELYLDTVSYDGVDEQARLLLLATGDLVRLVDQVNSDSWVQFTLSASVADMTGWFTLPADQTGQGPIPLGLTDGMLLTLYFLRPSRMVQQQLALANRANVVRGVQWYKANDVAAGAAGFAETGILRPPTGAMPRRPLMPLKQQWGVG
jgi:hypothetical protein